MPSTSKAQQRFMGLVHAYKKGEVKGSEVSKAVKDAAKSMKKKSTKDFASTKHKGLPNKVKKEDLMRLIDKYGAKKVRETIMAVRPKAVTVKGYRMPEEPDFEYDPEKVADEGFGGELKGKDKDKFEKARKENAEQLGYKLTGTSDIKESVNERYTLYTTNKIGDKVKKIKSYTSRQAAAVAMGKLVKNLETDYFPKNVDGLMYVKEATSLGADMLLGGIASVIKKAGMRPKSAKMMGGGFKVSKRDKVGFKIDVEIRGMDKKKTFPLQFETERGMLYVVIKNKPIKLGKYTMVTQAAQNLKKVGAALIGDKNVKRIA